jgi:poly-gamma-glutamate capsule biosynthesis protein CapA/YwtB (metallophosphatase superfamily)
LIIAAWLAAAPAAAAPAPLACLARYYAITPEQQDGRWFGRLPDGSRVPYDDGRTKTFDEKLNAPDVEDMFSIRYRPGAIRPVTAPDDDPGRIRVEEMFSATYGQTRAAVDVVPVDFLGRTLPVNRRRADAFSAVAARLRRLREADPALGAYLRRFAGTFVWRKIAGTNRQSAHSYGVSIDLDTSVSAYWRWQRPPAPLRWRNQIPQAIVDAFEAEGFIWGGRWFHYDTMHFEYRPELLDPSCYPPGRIQVAAGGDLQLAESSTTAQLDGVAGLLDGDLRFGNLEGPLTERGKPAGLDSSGKPTAAGGPIRFAAPPATAAILRHRLDVASLANNHALDQGEAGRADTERALQSAGIAAAFPGHDAVLAPLGVRVQILARDLGRGLAPADEDALATAVASARRAGAAVLVSLHFGREGVQLPSPAERRLAQRLIDAGASAVLGHGPHVIRGVERRGRGVIAYSLGNLAFACRCTDEKDALVLRFALGADGGVDDIVGLPIAAGLAGAPPRPADDAELSKLIADLSRDLGSDARVEGSVVRLR